jgi:ADP-ribosylation factor GTPase-activating protein 2/3
MKVGGNAAFQAYMSKNGGYGYSQSASASDIKAKYSSPAAQAYREELEKRKKADEVQYGPDKVVIEGSTVAPSTNNGNNKGDDEDDFFNTWDKPTLVKPVPTTNAPPSIGLKPSPSPSPSLPPSQPKTVTSSSLRSTSTSQAVKKPLGTRASTTSSTGSGKLKLGAKKGATPINFEEAEKKAKEDEERIKRLGYDSKAETEVVSSTSVQPQVTPSYSASKPKEDSRGHVKKDSADLERLGMGIRKLGFGQVTGIGGEEAARQAEKALRGARNNSSNEGKNILHIFS